MKNNLDDQDDHKINNEIKERKSNNDTINLQNNLLLNENMNNSKENIQSSNIKRDGTPNYIKKQNTTLKVIKEDVKNEKDEGVSIQDMLGIKRNMKNLEMDKNKIKKRFEDSYQNSLPLRKEESKIKRIAASIEVLKIKNDS